MKSIFLILSLFACSCKSHMNDTLLKADNSTKGFWDEVCVNDKGQFEDEDFCDMKDSKDLVMECVDADDKSISCDEAISTLKSCKLADAEIDLADCKRVMTSSRRKQCFLPVKQAKRFSHK